MNKKVLTLLIVVLIVAIIGGIVFAVNMNKTNDAGKNAGEINNSESLSNSENKNQTNLNENTNTETTRTGKILVLYFSQSGNTEAVANIIHNEVGGDIIKLETTQSYPSDYNELVDYAQKEQKQNARPELKTKIDNIDQYDTIFLGYPNWWADMPMPIYTFLDEYNLSGKTIAPFITHGGSGLSGTPNKIKKEEPNATVTDGLAVSGSSAKNSQSTVKSWLSKINIASNKEENNRIKLSFNNEEIYVKLENNNSTQDLLKMLPVTIKFEDYNNTEKIAMLDTKLDTSDALAGYDPQVGDFAYYAPWGNLSVFYKDFGYSNSLVKLGVFENGIDKIQNITDGTEIKIEEVK